MAPTLERVENEEDSDTPDVEELQMPVQELEWFLQML